MRFSTVFWKSLAELTVRPAPFIRDPSLEGKACWLVLLHDEPSRRRGPRLNITARFPVPRPLPASVAAGRFGYDEEHRPIRPAPDEVRAITENQVDKLIDLLDALAEPGKVPGSRERHREAFDALIAAYARDFGDKAARQLEAYVRRQASLDEESRTSPGYGHRR